MPSSPLRLVFMGTPSIAATILERLLERPEFSVLAVATQPDRPKGRSLQPQASPVKERAQAAGIPVFQPERARDPLKLYTVSDVQTTDQYAGTQADHLLIDGAWYKVLNVGPRHSLLPHVKVIAIRVQESG